LRFPDCRKVGSGRSGSGGCGNWQQKVQEWNGQRAVGRSGGSPYITLPLGVHVLVHKVKLDVGEVDLADVLRSSWIGRVKLLD
jgi:hypothetical protein